jgi:hypothetical protein
MILLNQIQISTPRDTQRGVCLVVCLAKKQAKIDVTQQFNEARIEGKPFNVEVGQQFAGTNKYPNNRHLQYEYEDNQL